MSRYGRTYDGRRFRYRFVGEDPTVLTDRPNTLLSSQRVGEELRLQEDTLQEDAYDASLLTTAAYATGELEVSKSLRLQAGARVELASQALGSGSDYAVAGVATETSRRDADVMPAFNATYALGEHSSVRSGYSYTLVRPRFRELAPFLYFDYTRRRSISGNTELLNTHIHDATCGGSGFPPIARWLRPLASTSALSDLSNRCSGLPKPMRHFATPPAPICSASRSKAACRWRAWRRRSRLYVGANATLGWSQIELDESAAINTSQSRPLYGQSPYAVNASVQYRGARVGDITLAYNVAGRRIVDVGVDGLPDTYEMPLHRVDATYARKVAAQWKLKISATNLLGDTVLLQQGDLAVNQQRLGTTISASLEWIPLP